MDVSIGTVRTIAMVQGHARIAVGLAFVEVLVWVVAVAQVVAGRGRVLGTFSGQSAGQPVNLIFVSAMRRQVPGILEAARRVDPELFYLVEMAAGWSENLRPLPDPTGWRAVFKKK